MKSFINKHLHLPIRVILEGKWGAEAARAPSQCPIWPEPHLTVPNLASAGMVLITSGSPNPSAALTNWIKLHWWKTSRIPLWTPRSAGLGRNSRLIIPVLWSWGRAWWGWAEVGAQPGAGGGTSTASARREQQHLLPPDDTYLTVISPSLPRGNELWFKPLEVFLLGLSLTAFFYFIS